MKQGWCLQVSGAVPARETLAKSGKLQDTLRKLAEDAVRRNASFFVLPDGEQSCTILPDPRTRHQLALLQQRVLHSLAHAPRFVPPNASMALALSVHTPGMQRRVYAVSMCWRSELN